MSRMEKYDNNKKESRRTSKNQDLYQDLKDYTSVRQEIIVDEVPLVEIDLSVEKKKRVIKNQDIVGKNNITMFHKNEIKEYDINKVLNSAKKNRTTRDLLEDKRSLNNDEYNITKNVDLKKIDEFKESKKKEVLNEVEKEELKELINTIYSNNLKEEIKKEEDKRNEESELFSDLIASDDETIIDEDMANKLIQEEKRRKTDEFTLTSELKNMDNSFFTKSLELSREDFDDMDTSFVDKKGSNKKFIIITVLVLLIIAGISYYIFYK